MAAPMPHLRAAAHRTRAPRRVACLLRLRAVLMAPETTLPHVLTPETARTLRRVGGHARDAVAKRDDAIRSAVAAGASYREVGEAVGLSHTAVAFIVRGRVSRVGQEEER